MSDLTKAMKKVLNRMKFEKLYHCRDINCHYRTLIKLGQMGYVVQIVRGVFEKVKDYK